MLCTGAYKPGLFGTGWVRQNVCTACGHLVEYAPGKQHRPWRRRTLRRHYTDGSYIKGRGPGRFPRNWAVPA